MGLSLHPRPSKKENARKKTFLGSLHLIFFHTGV
jgi:hypothetical protein